MSYTVSIIEVQIPDISAFGRHYARVFRTTFTAGGVADLVVSAPSPISVMGRAGRRLRVRFTALDGRKVDFIVDAVPGPHVAILIQSEDNSGTLTFHELRSMQDRIDKSLRLH